MKNKLFIPSLILLALSLAYILGGVDSKEASAQYGQSACTVSTSTIAYVGDDISQTVLASNGRRVWAQIEQPANATNTLSLSFKQGAAAVKDQGFILTHKDVASTTENQIRFGLGTEFPYTGAVTGITSVGSTTVLVTECVQ